MNQTTVEDREYIDFVNARKKYVGASDCPIIMRKSPWKTPFQLWEDKLGLSKPEPDTYYMKRGRDLEPLARDAYIMHTGNYVVPKQVFHPHILYMMANMDGITEDHSVAVEIKCPGEMDHLVAKQGNVPEKYMPQLQHQLAVIGIDQIDYFSYRDGDFVLIEVQRDESFIKQIYEEERKFWDCVENLVPPEMEGKDFNERNDEEWKEISQLYLEVNEELKGLLQREKEIKEKVIEVSEGKNVIGNGIRLQKLLRKGNIDYAKIPELENVDLEKYRKPTTQMWRISPC